MATSVFELFGSIAIKNRDANEALKDTATKAERTGKQIQDAFKKIGSVSLKIGKGVAAAATAIGTAWAANIETTREYRTAMAKLDAAFVANGHSAETAYNTYKDLQRVLGDTDQATEAANHLAVLCENEQELDKWTDICTGVFATFGDSLPIESLTEAANETAKTGQLTGSLADALNWAGIKEDDFQKKLEACRTEEERQNLIMDTLYWTYKKAADQYEETGASVMKANEAQEKLNSAMAKIGEIGEPIMTGLKGWIADMVTAAAPHLQTLVDKLVNFDDTMTNEVWPWIQQEAKMKLGMELPDWETFKTDVSTWWTGTAKPYIESWCKFTLAFAGILPWNEENQQALINWWDGVYAAIGSICTWKIPRPLDLTNEDADAVIMSIQTWWKGVLSRIRLFIGITPQVQANYGNYQSALSSAGGGTTTSQLLTNSFTTNSDSNYNFNAIRDLFFGSPDGSHASGLDYVPRDGYIARLHKGEQILTSAQANEWRGGGNVEALLSQMVTLLSQQKNIVLDSGVMVGQLAPAMDAQLGTIASRKRRGS